MGRVFFVEPKPLTLIQAINRTAAATGSYRNAMAASHADYNGHSNRLDWNTYREYYVGEYFYGGRFVFTRSESFATAVEESLREFDRQGAGASLVVTPKEEDYPLAEAHPRLVELTEEVKQRNEANQPWQFKEIIWAIRGEQQLGVPHLIHLQAATSPEDYKARLDAEFAKRRRPTT